MSNDFPLHRVTLSTGLSLDVVDEGPRDGEVLIFLHGFPESHRTWRHQIAHLSQRYRCIAPDQRGYARSDKPVDLAEYKVPKLTADVLALADALGVGEFTLVGHDWGGAIAWATALRHQATLPGGRIRRLIQCNAAHPYVYQHSLVFDAGQRAATQYIREFRERDIEGEVAAKGVAWFFDDRFAKLSARGMTAADRAAYIDEWSQSGALTGMLNWYRASPLQVPAPDAPAVSTPFLDAPFPRLTIPALIVWGLEDEALLPCQLDGLERHIDDVTIERIEGAGHFVPWEAPDAVNAAMDRWLAGHPLGH